MGKTRRYGAVTATHSPSTLRADETLAVGGVVAAGRVPASGEQADDTVPSSSVVGEDGPEEVFVPPAADVEGSPDVKIPRGNASQAEWAAFIRHQNPPFDPDKKSRDELREWWRDRHGSPEDDTSDAPDDAEEEGPPAGAAAAAGGTAAGDDAEDG